MSSLLINKTEHRERVLKAIQDYNRLRKGTLSQERQDKPPQAEPGLFDGVSEGVSDEQ